MMNEKKQKTKENYNRRGFYFFICVIIFSSVWALYFVFFKSNIDLAELSDSKQKESVSAGLTKEEQTRPWIITENLISHGSKIYKAQCALCHGAEGLGDGTPGLIPPPRNLVEGKWKLGGSPQALFKTLQTGIEGGSMVSFKHLPNLDRWALVHYIRSITKNKTAYNEQELEEFAKTAL
ncbi:MAG: cytochrome c [Bdellovibrionales bacterium]|nr:cytochrome c [Bdellovibrionales bacterium]